MRSDHYWQQVRAYVRCALGDHDVLPGRFVRFRSGDFRRLASCEQCLAARGVFRPAGSGELDGRLKRAGAE